MAPETGKNIAIWTFRSSPECAQVTLKGEARQVEDGLAKANHRTPSLQGRQTNRAVEDHGSCREADQKIEVTPINIFYAPGHPMTLRHTKGPPSKIDPA